MTVARGRIEKIEGMDALKGLETVVVVVVVVDMGSSFLGGRSSPPIPKSHHCRDRITAADDSSSAHPH
jgi:hypothetical protein